MAKEEILSKNLKLQKLQETQIYQSNQAKNNKINKINKTNQLIILILSISVCLLGTISINYGIKYNRLYNEVNKEASGNNTSNTANNNTANNISTSTPSVSYRTRNSSVSTSNSISNITNTEEIITRSTITLSNGTYIVGTDIQPGTYDLEVVSGFGVITGDLESGYICERIGLNDSNTSETYKGLELSINDKFEIKNGVEIKFIPR